MSRRAQGVPPSQEGRTATVLRCAECGAESDQLATGWRAYLAPEPDEEPEGEIFMFCPGCAEREFGDSAWEDPLG